MSPYQERARRQGEEWVQGDSRHNTVDDECCPDFSCCVPTLFEPDRSKRLTVFRCECVRNGWSAPPLDA